MSTSSESTFRTDLVAYLMDLLDFVEDRIKKSQSDPSSRNGALTEAMGAFPIIRDRLLREDQALHAQLMLVGFFDEDLTTTSALPADEFVKKTEHALQLVRFVSSVVGSRRSEPAAQ